MSDLVLVQCWFGPSKDAPRFWTKLLQNESVCDRKIAVVILCWFDGVCGAGLAEARVPQARGQNYCKMMTMFLGKWR